MDSRKNFEFHHWIYEKFSHDDNLSWALRMHFLQDWSCNYIYEKKIETKCRLIRGKNIILWEMRKDIELQYFILSAIEEVEKEGRSSKNLRRLIVTFTGRKKRHEEWKEKVRLKYEEYMGKKKREEARRERRYKIGPITPSGYLNKSSGLIAEFYPK